MSGPKLDADVRKAQIIKMGAQIANEHGITAVSNASISGRIADLTTYGVKYHFPKKQQLIEAVYNSGLLDEQVKKEACDLGMIVENM